MDCNEFSRISLACRRYWLRIADLPVMSFNIAGIRGDSLFVGASLLDRAWKAGE